MVSDECYNLAKGIFQTWVFIEAARRYATVQDGEKATTATINARGVVYDAHSDGYLTDDETVALHADLKKVQDYLGQKQLAAAQQGLEQLSEQVFMTALDKVVECECKRA